MPPQIKICSYLHSLPHRFSFIEMNEVPITRSVLNVNLQHKGKAKNNIKNAFHSNELSFIEQRQKNQKHSKKHKNTTEDISGEGMVLRFGDYRQT